MIVRSLTTLALAAGLVLAAGPATAATSQEYAIDWKPCVKDKNAECGTLELPVNWKKPNGEKFSLAVARRSATDPQQRVGTLVFGPGGPGDSGVERVVTGMSRFSTELQKRFDIVSFDPRGVGGSSPVRCSTSLLGQQPSPVIRSKADFRATISFNRKLAADCREHTGPVYEHLDTLSTVHDLDALRKALGEAKLTFHGSSYGTLLGQQYAEQYPRRVRALVLESVVDHSLGTSAFMQAQAVTEQEAFEQFVAWCGRTASCALHGQDVKALWERLLARADAGELPGLNAFTLTVRAQKAFYDPDWAEFAEFLAQLPTVAASKQSQQATSAYPMAAFCDDWSLPVRNYAAYEKLQRRITELAPQMRYPRSLLAISTCLGSPQKVSNPQHVPQIHGAPTILLTNARYDPASGYNWATNVARQLGKQAVLLTYDGWGHGTYNSSPCAQQAIDDYLINLVVPAPDTHCPALEPAG
ncbi:peptidase [Kineosporia sp. NBRC 101677]|uniref:alpha/beta hydrolase n=1 Tax=Kineosporia sp. NBRC 101677 TaxID=3032197 RepID=UPI0024A33725|nr:alpha/beta hydrolase [Kineosporia sp. NBRC 101677]GLY15299.1 peptidase [Kineosporia sp. NBRC 101677]